MGQVTDTSLELRWQTPPSNGFPLMGYLASYARDASASDEGDLSLSPAGTRHGVALTCAAMVAMPAPADAAEQPAQGTQLSYTLAGLARGTSYLINMTACNALGEGETSCVCAREMCGEIGLEGTPLNGCTELPTPAHTHAEPSQPDEPVDAVDTSLDERKKTEIFMRWTPPDNHGSPISLTEVSVTESEEINGTSTELTQRFYLPHTPSSRRRLADSAASPPVQTFNLSGLHPATQYRCSVRMQNAYGWSAMSLDAWLWTRPAAPEATPPTCEQRIVVDKVQDTKLYVDVQPAEDNGQPVLDYELNLTHAISGELHYSGLVGTSAEDRAVQVSVEQINSYMYLRHERNISLEPGAPYTVRVRARNGIGWSDASVGVNCTASELRGEVFPWIAVLVPTILVVLCLLGTVFWCYTSNLNKIFAPKLRMKVVDDEVLKDFVDDSVTAMEDADPELVLNPVLVARMQMEKESAMRGKKGKGKKGMGGNKTGGLARLGLQVSTEEGKKAAKPMQVQVDEFLIGTIGLDAGPRDKQTVAAAKKQTVATDRSAKKADGQAGLATARGAARSAACRTSDIEPSEKFTERL